MKNDEVVGNIDREKVKKRKKKKGRSKRRVGEEGWTANTLSLSLSLSFSLCKEIKNRQRRRDESCAEWKGRKRERKRKKNRRHSIPRPHKTAVLSWSTYGIVGATGLVGFHVWGRPDRQPVENISVCECRLISQSQNGSSLSATVSG